jgi:hypothetical protein
MDDGGDYAILSQGRIIAEAIFMTAASTFQPVEANARLIAGAPDLLAALKWALDNLSMPTHLSDPEYGLHYQAARAAIAKAEGER